MIILTPTALTASTFEPYGQVIAARTAASSEANQGTASRFNLLATLQNDRSNAKTNVCLFRSAKRPLHKVSHSSKSTATTTPTDDNGSGFFPVRLLERHPYSSQMFIPLNCQQRWLIIVALPKREPDQVDPCQEGKAGPDMSTLRAFMARSDQGINFAAGVWHHPLIALESTTDFACVVYEDDTKDDCHIVEMTNVEVNVPPRNIQSSM